MKHKKSLSLSTLCGFAFFGHACGASFSTGRLAVQYCTRHGPWGVLGGIGIYVFVCIWLFITMEYARLIKAESYSDVVKTIYWPNKIVGKVMLLIWDVIQLLSIIVTCASCISGSGSVLESVFGLNYNIGMLLFVLILVAMFLAPGVFKTLGKMSLPMFFLLMVVCAVSIVVGWDNLVATFAGAHNDVLIADGTGTFKSIFDDSFTYACTNLGFIGTGAVYASKFESRKDTVKALSLACVLTSIGLAICVTATLTTFPECINITLPFLAIIQTLTGPGTKIIYVVYFLLLYVAYCSTAGSLVLSGVARYTPAVNKIIKNNKVCTVVIVVVLLCAGTLLGRLGLMTIVNKGFGTVGKLRAPLWYIPLLVLGPISIKRVKGLLKRDGNLDSLYNK